MRRHRSCTLPALVAALALAAPLAGQDGRGHWFFPLDLGQGFVLDAGEPTPYVFSARLAPQIGIGSGGAIRVGPAFAARYANPDWEVAAGARASARLLQVGLSHWGLFLSAEQLWNTDGNMPGAASLVLNAGALRAGAWVVRYWDEGDTALEFSLGSDLSVLFPLLFPGEDPDPPFTGPAAAVPLPAPPAHSAREGA